MIQRLNHNSHSEEKIQEGKLTYIVEIGKWIRPKIIFDQLCNLQFRVKYYKRVCVTERNQAKKVRLIKRDKINDRYLVMNVIHIIFLLSVSKPSKETAIMST